MFPHCVGKRFNKVLTYLFFTVKKPVCKCPLPSAGDSFSKVVKQTMQMTYRSSILEFKPKVDEDEFRSRRKQELNHQTTVPLCSSDLLSLLRRVWLFRKTSSPPRHSNVNFYTRRPEIYAVNLIMLRNLRLKKCYFIS